MNKNQQKSGLPEFGKPEALGRWELEGFVARSGGADRGSNPYDLQQHQSADGSARHESWAIAWWCGWDNASAQLA